MGSKRSLYQGRVCRPATHEVSIFQTTLQIPKDAKFKDVDGKEYSLRGAHIVWNMDQQMVHVVVKVNRDIRNLENQEMVKYLKVVNC